MHRPRPPGLCDKHGTEVLRKGGQGMALQTSDKRAPGPELGPGGWRAEELGPGGGPECPTLSSEGVEREGADAGNRFLSTLCGALHLTPSHPSPQGPAHTSPPHPPSIASILCPLPSALCPPGKPCPATRPNSRGPHSHSASVPGASSRAGGPHAEAGIDTQAAHLAAAAGPSVLHPSPLSDKLPGRGCY